MKNEIGRSFEIQNLIMIVMMSIASVLNYLFQIILGRFLDVDAYGVANSLLSIINMIAIPGAIVSMLASKKISQVYASVLEICSKEVLNILKLSWYLLGILIMIGIFIFIPIGRIAKLDNLGLLVMCFGIAGISVVRQAATGVLQGLQSFICVGIQSNLWAILKLSFFGVFSLVGFRLVGAMIALLCAEIITVVYCLNRIKSFKLFQCNYSFSLKQYLFEERKTIISISIVQGLLLILSNGDILIISSFYSEYDVGLYSSALVIARIGLYVSTMITCTLLPMASYYNASGKKTSHIFVKSLLYCGVLFVCFAVSVLGVRYYLMEFLYGERYIRGSELFVPIFAYMFPLAILTLVINYSVAIGKIKFVAGVVGMTVLFILLISLFQHNSIVNTLYMFAGLLSISVIISLIYILAAVGITLRKDNGKLNS